MKLQKFRWSRVYESSEEELLGFLQARGVTAERWTAGEFEATAQATFKNNLTLWCAEGSMVCHVGGSAFSLQPGDALHIPARIPYEIAAGISGCVYYFS